MSAELNRLLEIMARLRDPQGGCPWDIEQTFTTIAPYTIEEAYEVADAIEKGDMASLREELGDLLLQVVFHSRMAEEDGHFAFEDVARAVNDKMIARHPHVFGSVEVESAEAQTRAWEDMKAQERKAKAATRDGRTSVLDDVAAALPALLRAAKLQKRAARVGFDWENAGQIFDKIAEEMDEVRAELSAPQIDRARLEDEIGDLIFAVTNLARHLDIDPEGALRATNAKFTRRFHHIEARLGAEGRSPAEATLEEMEAYWQEAKGL
ncbi:nucleoside triphosphate pyrophosphohydrolase [Radicibacter daui]|uniref:nucleoside triphosphate pyrophosphohydrolase n=1 Tax=Radicibacter daui TaxID=3064829 RepID=UPI004046FF43